jgi:hypothetical protein
MRSPTESKRQRANSIDIQGKAISLPFGTSINQNAVIFRRGRRRYNGQSGISVDLSHLRCLTMHILDIVLNDAQPVYPNVFNPKLAGTADNILNERRQVNV